LRIFDIDGKTKSLYMVSELGKITWPLRFEKLERIHKIIHAGKATLLPYEIDKLIPIDLVDRKVNKLWRYQMESLTRWVEELRDPS
jgi:hypothetical protein